MTEQQVAARPPYWLGIGILVSIAKWDKTVPPNRAIQSPAIVVSIKPERVCESGFMVELKGASGKHITLDMNWIIPYE